MTNEEKQQLIKDLCARLPYGVICGIGNYEGQLTLVCPKGDYCILQNSPHAIENVKPYLRPMLSMTEEEKEKFDKVLKSCNDKVFTCPDKERQYNFFDAEQEDFMNAHHFDYRGLIKKGLALEAPEGMYKNK